jgi:hypothetical protein
MASTAAHACALLLALVGQHNIAARVLQKNDLIRVLSNVMAKYPFNPFIARFAKKATARIRGEMSQLDPHELVGSRAFLEPPAPRLTAAQNHEALRRLTGDRPSQRFFERNLQLSDRPDLQTYSPKGTHTFHDSIVASPKGTHFHTVSWDAVNNPEDAGEGGERSAHTPPPASFFQRLQIYESAGHTKGEVEMAMEQVVPRNPGRPAGSESPPLQSTMGSRASGGGGVKREGDSRHTTLSLAQLREVLLHLCISTESTADSDVQMLTKYLFQNDFERIRNGPSFGGTRIPKQHLVWAIFHPTKLESKILKRRLPSKLKHSQSEPGSKGSGVVLSAASPPRGGVAVPAFLRPSSSAQQHPRILANQNGPITLHESGLGNARRQPLSQDLMDTAQRLKQSNPMSPYLRPLDFPAYPSSSSGSAGGPYSHGHGGGGGGFVTRDRRPQTAAGRASQALTSEAHPKSAAVPSGKFDPNAAAPETFELAELANHLFSDPLLVSTEEHGPATAEGELENHSPTLIGKPGSPKTHKEKLDMMEKMAKGGSLSFVEKLNIMMERATKEKDREKDGQDSESILYLHNSWIPARARRVDGMQALEDWKMCVYILKGRTPLQITVQFVHPVTGKSVQAEIHDLFCQVICWNALPGCKYRTGISSLPAIIVLEYPY